MDNSEDRERLSSCVSPGYIEYIRFGVFYVGGHVFCLRVRRAIKTNARVLALAPHDKMSYPPKSEQMCVCVVCVLVRHRWCVNGCAARVRAKMSYLCVAVCLWTHACNALYLVCIEERMFECMFACLFACGEPVSGNARPAHRAIIAPTRFDRTHSMNI